MQMNNLREFVRAMALMTDKLQLVVSTDVNRLATPEPSLDDTSGGRLPLMVRKLVGKLL
jgi:hypothetical protein